MMSDDNEWPFDFLPHHSSLIIHHSLPGDRKGVIRLPWEQESVGSIPTPLNSQ
jgi:hypothetical protein